MTVNCVSHYFHAQDMPPLTRRLLRLLCLVALALTVSPPLALAAHLPALAGLGYLLLAPVCHQIPDRCLQLAGYPLALCARCSGLLLGAIVGFLAATRQPRGTVPALPGRTLPLVAGTLMVLDVTAPMVGLYGNNLASRLSTGILFGAASAPFLAAGLSELALLVGRQGVTGSRLGRIESDRPARAHQRQDAPDLRVARPAFLQAAGPACLMQVENGETQA